MPSWRIVCDGWMKVRPTYAFFTRPCAVRDAALLRRSRSQPACRSRAPGSRGRRRPAPRAQAARPTSTRVACTRRPAMRGVGTGEVDVLEQAAAAGSARRSACDRRPCSSIASNSPGSTSRTNDAPTMSSAAVSLATPSRARAGRVPAGGRRAGHERRTASSRPEDQRERAFEHAAAPRAQPSRGGEVADGWRAAPVISVGVGGRRQRRSGRRRPSAGRPSGARSAVLVRLPLWPRAIPPRSRSTGRTAARSPTCTSRSSSSGCGRWRCGREARRASTRRRPARPGRGPCRRRSVCHRYRDAGGLLAAVLQRVEAVVGELGHLFAGSPDAEDATGILGPGIVGHVDRAVDRECGNGRVGDRRSCTSESCAGCTEGTSPGYLAARRLPPRRACDATEVTRPGTRQARSARQNRAASAVRSARSPLARIRPSRAASCHGNRPVASSTNTTGSASTTLGGVPRVCRGPGARRSNCTAAYGGTRTSTDRPGARCRGWP